MPPSEPLMAVTPCRPISSARSSRPVERSQTRAASLTVIRRLSEAKPMKKTPSEPITEPCTPPRRCNSRPVSTSQTVTELSLPEAAMRRLSRLNATAGASANAAWPLLERSRSLRLVAVSQSLIVLLRYVPVASSLPSGLKSIRVAPKRLL